jgi:transcriptional regulator with AAA-type ATPase domain
VRFIAAAQPEDAEHIIPDLRNRLGHPDFIKMPTLEQELRKGKQLYIKIIEDSLNQAKKILGFNKEIKISREVYPLLREHRYPGNFRELKNILKSAIRSAEMNGRTEIELEDLIDVFEKSREFYGEDKEESPSNESNLKNIKLKDIIDYAHQEKVRIIETKINEVLNSGKNLKSVLMNEGLSEKEYLNFRKKVVTITGKRIKEFGL